MILTFKEFLSEKFIPQPDDNIASASDKNFFNDEENLIVKFNSYKSDLINIYNNYVDEVDLMNKLFSKKFIVAKTTDPKKKKFVNKYLGKYAKICDKKRRIKELEEIMKGDGEDIINYDTTINNNKGNQTIKDYNQNKIDSTKERIFNNEEKIRKLEKEVLDLDKELRDELKVLKTKLELAKKKIRKDELSKKSNPIESDEEEQKK